MAETYITSTGDTVDLIAWRQYGTQGARVTERVLEANPGLADYGTELPPGVSVTLPDLVTIATEQGVRLWD